MLIADLAETLPWPEQLELFRRLKDPSADPAGAMAARETLATTNMRLAVLAAKTIRKRFPGHPAEDIVGESLYVLVKAVGLFDPEVGVTFSTYAMRSMLASVPRMLEEARSLVHVPAYLREELRTPKGAHRAEYVEAARAALAMRPEYAPTEEFPAVCPDAGADDDAEEARWAVEAAVASLPRRYREVVRLRHGVGGEGPLTLKEVGARFGLTHERVRQIQVKAEAILARRLARRLPDAAAGSEGCDAPDGAKACVDCGTRGGYVPKGCGKPVRIHRRCAKCHRRRQSPTPAPKDRRCEGCGTEGGYTAPGHSKPRRVKGLCTKCDASARRAAEKRASLAIAS